MSIDVTDYTNRLSDLKSDYQDKFDSQTRAHERQKDILESANKEKLESQRTAYDNQKAILEKDVGEIKGRYAKRTDEALKNMSSEYNNEIDKERVKSEQDLFSVRKNFNEKMSASKKGFEQSLSEINDLKVRDASIKRTQYKKQLSDLRGQATKDAESIAENARDKMDVFNTEHHKERKSIFFKNNKEKELAQKEAIFRENSLKNRYGDALETMKRGNERRVEDLKNDQRQKVKQLAGNFSQGQTEQLRKFNDALVDQRQKSGQDIKNSKSDSLKRESELNKKMADRVRDERVNYEKKLASLGPQADSLNEKSNAFLQRQRINNLKRQLYNERASLSRESKKNEEVSKSRLDDMASSFRQKNYETERKFRQAESNVRSQTAKEKRDLIDSYKNVLSKQKVVSENDKQDIINFSKRKLEKQTNRLGKQINIIQEQNQKQLSEIQKNATLEKSKYIRSSQEKFSQEKANLIDNLRKDYSEVYVKYENKLNEMKQQRESLRNIYEEKILDIQARHSGQVKDIREKQRVRRIEEMNNFKKEFKSKDLSNKKTIRGLEQKFTSKLNDQRVESDRFLKQTMRQAESQMRKLRLEYDEKLVNFNKEKNNLISDLSIKSDKEKEMLVNQYEQKLANLQDIINNEREKARLRTSQLS